MAMLRSQTANSVHHYPESRYMYWYSNFDSCTNLCSLTSSAASLQYQRSLHIVGRSVTINSEVDLVTAISKLVVLCFDILGLVIELQSCYYIITRAQYAPGLCVCVRRYVCVCVVKKHACLRLTARKSPRKHSLQLLH